MPALYGRVVITPPPPPTAATCKPQRAGFAEIYKYLPSHRSRHTFLARLGPTFCPLLSAQPSLHDDGADVCVMKTPRIDHSSFPVGPRSWKSIALDGRCYRKRVNRTVPAIIDYCLSLILRVRFFRCARMRPGWEIASLPVAIFGGKWLWICYCKNGSSFTEHSNRLTGGDWLSFRKFQIREVAFFVPPAMMAYLVWRARISLSSASLNACCCKSEGKPLNVNGFSRWMPRWIMLCIGRCRWVLNKRARAASKNKI